MQIISIFSSLIMDIFSYIINIVPTLTSKPAAIFSRTLDVGRWTLWLNN